MRFLGIDCSPTGAGKTRATIEAVLAGAARHGADITVNCVAATDIDATLSAMREADGFVVGSPIYRATFAAPFKDLMDLVPRGMWGETEAPITAKAVATVGTGASFHHFLAVASMRNVLVDFFAAHVVSPGLYVPADGFADGELTPSYGDLAEKQGLALAALAESILQFDALRAITPQA